MGEVQARTKRTGSKRGSARPGGGSGLGAVAVRTPKWAADKIESWPLKKLLPYAKNPRTHSAKQVDQIVRAINEYGWTNPVLVDEKGSVLAGHGRILAAQELHLETIPTMVARGWTDAQKRAYRIWDNQSVLLGDWDMGLLSEELKFLDSSGFDIGFTGFDQADLISFMAHMDVDRGALLSLVDITVKDPKHEVGIGNHFVLDERHHLFCDSVITGWPRWTPYLVSDALFCPFPGPFVLFSVKAKDHQLILVQPDPYIAGHCLDRYAEVHGNKLIRKVEDVPIL